MELDSSDDLVGFPRFLLNLALFSFPFLLLLSELAYYNKFFVFLAFLCSLLHLLFLLQFGINPFFIKDFWFFFETLSFIDVV